MHFAITGMRMDCNPRLFAQAKPFVTRKHHTLSEYWGLGKRAFYPEINGKARIFFASGKSGRTSV
jgi:hypothetical protein